MHAETIDRFEPVRPMRQLLAHVRHLTFSDSGSIDAAHASPELLRSVTENAETALSTIHQGLGAIGHLLAHSAVPIEDGTIGADTLESLGFLVAELGDLAAACMTLAAHCRRATGPPPARPLA